MPPRPSCLKNPRANAAHPASIECARRNSQSLFNFYTVSRSEASSDGEEATDDPSPPSDGEEATDDPSPPSDGEEATDDPSPPSDGEEATNPSPPSEEADEDEAASSEDEEDNFIISRRPTGAHGRCVFIDSEDEEDIDREDEDIADEEDDKRARKRARTVSLSPTTNDTANSNQSTQSTASSSRAREELLSPYSNRSDAIRAVLNGDELLSPYSNRSDAIRAILNGDESSGDLGDLPPSVYIQHLPILEGRPSFRHPDGTFITSIETGGFGDCLFSSAVYSIAVASGAEAPHGADLTRASRRLRNAFTSWIRVNLDRNVNLRGTYEGATTLREAVQWAFENVEHDIDDPVLFPSSIDSVDSWLDYYSTHGAYVGDEALGLFTIFIATVFGYSLQILMSVPSSNELQIMNNLDDDDSYFMGLQTVNLLFTRGFRNRDFEDTGQSRDTYAGHFTSLQEASAVADVAAAAAVAISKSADERKKNGNGKRKRNNSNGKGKNTSGEGKGKKSSGKGKKSSGKGKGNGRQTTLNHMKKPSAKAKPPTTKFTPEQSAIIRQAGEMTHVTKTRPKGFWNEVSKRVGGGKTAEQCKSHYGYLKRKANKPLCRFPGCQTPKAGSFDGFCYRHANQQPVTSKAGKGLAKKRRRNARTRRKRYHSNPHYRLAHLVRNRTSEGLSNVMANPAQVGRTIYSYIGCTWAQLHSYIEAQFLPGMTWMNYHLWHIDHIRPIASFDFLNDPIQLDRAFRWSNLRPMWANDNIKKSDKPTPAFDWCPNQNRWMWGPVHLRLPADRHHVNIDLESLESIENDAADDEILNYQLDNEEEDADDEEEDADDEEEDP